MAARYAQGKQGYWEEGAKGFDGKRPAHDPAAHRNRDARRSMKSNAAHHGYGSHAAAGSRHRYIRKGVVTDAGVHDGKAPARPLPKTKGEGPGFFADGAYGAAGTGAGKGAFSRHTGCPRQSARRTNEHRPRHLPVLPFNGKARPGHALRRGCSPPTSEKGAWKAKN